MDWFDPAYKAGGPVISIVKLIENLHTEFDFYVIAGSVDYGDEETLLGIETDKWINWRDKAQVYYVGSNNKSRKRIFELLDETDANVYYIQGVFSLYFSIYPLIWWHQAKKERAIIATRGMFHTSALNVKRRKKLIYLYAAKIMGWYHHVTFHSTNPEETIELKKIMGNEATYAEASNFPRILPYNPELHKKQKGELKLLSVARISPEKNTLFLLDALMLVKSNVSLTIVGNYNDTNYFEQFTKKMELMPAHINVNYIGHKNINELQKSYDNHHVFILPTKGENYGHSIIEALSSGLPCIISNKTPWSGLEQFGAGYNLEESTEKYAEVIDKYFEMEEYEFSEKTKNARNFAEQNIHLDQIKMAYKNLLK